MTQALQLNPPLIQTEGFLDTREQRIALAFNGLVFLIGFISLIGIIFGIQELYNWDSRGLVMHYQAALSLIIISMGYALQQAAIVWRKPGLTSVARLCYAGTLVLGLWAMTNFMNAGSITLEAFLRPSSPVSGHISFHTALGILLSSLAALAVSVVDSKRAWTAWTAQVLVILLISLASFILAENAGPLTLFRYLASIPAGAGWFCFSLALLFYPFENLHLRTPFFSSGLIRLYTGIFITLWLLIVAWQAIWSNVALGITDFTASYVGISAVVDELLETGLSAFILGIGLHMLSRMIFLRTTRDALQEANGKLETSLDSIRMLSSTLSHDLKTPIKIQMNIMEMLQQGKFGDSISSGTVQEMLTAMLESKQFEHELVLNLVDLMRYKMQEERFIPKPFVINKLLTDIQTQLEPLARRKDQVLTVHPYPNKDEITADYFGLKRVLHNLVNNAIQHIGNGCRIEVKVQKRAGDYLFKVEDNGPGIPADVQEHLFTRFNRVSSSGLGLYITKQIVNRHGGNIWVESKPGEGTTFSFTLPASGNEEQ